MEKRGFVVMIVFVLFFGLSFFSMAVEDDSPITPTKYLIIGGRWDDDITNYPLYTDLCDQLDVTITHRIKQGDPINIVNDPDNDEECQLNNIPELSDVPARSPTVLPSGKQTGCWFIVSEDDGDEDDDAAWAIMDEGSLLEPSKYTLLSTIAKGDYGHSTPASISHDWWQVHCSETSSDGYICLLGGDVIVPLSGGGHVVPETAGYRFRANYPLLCAQDGFWYECKEGSGEDPGTIGSKAYVGDNIWKCALEENGLPVWQKEGTDEDRDGYITSLEEGGIDCSDSPSSNPDPSFCPDVENCDSDVRNYQCAKCINPTSPEICGDEINNDCRGNGREFGAEVTNLEGATPDSCDDFPQGCQATGTDFLTDNEENIDEFGERSDEAIPMAYSNDKGLKFSWTDTNGDAAGGGYCCGYHGIGDLGEPTEDGSAICLSNDNELVGTPTTNPSETLTFDACLGDWCWVPASGKSQFQIATIKSPTETYDVVSDAVKWYECKEAGYLADRDNLADFPGEEDGAPSSSDFQKAQNRLACYQEGGHYSWAENFYS